VPFEQAGACPVEGCVHREWIANATVTVRAARRSGAPPQLDGSDFFNAYAR
jgi:hypothetical protein